MVVMSFALIAFVYVLKVSIGVAGFDSPAQAVIAAAMAIKITDCKILFFIRTSIPVILSSNQKLDYIVLQETR